MSAATDGFSAMMSFFGMRGREGYPQKEYRINSEEKPRAFRAYAPKELAKLDADCRGLLIYFEQSGILSPQTRETVIDRALAATGDGLTIEQLKLVILMVLWKHQTPSSRLVAEDLLSPIGARLPS